MRRVDRQAASRARKQAAQRERDLVRDRERVDKLVEMLGDYMRSFYANPVKDRPPAILDGPRFGCLATAAALRALLIEQAVAQSNEDE